MTAGWIGPAGRSPSLMSPESEAKASASPPLLRYGERPMPEADRRHIDGSSAEVRK